jgi:hypothetical protein
VITLDQMQDAIDAARRMRNSVDAHLAFLDSKAARMSAEGQQIPSENIFFLYVSDDRGLIRLQQDAAFVVESVLVVERNTDVINVPQFYELSLKDANAGRDLTGGFHAVYKDNPLTEEDTDFVPGRLFVPITQSADPMVIPNVDDWKTLKTEYILPRGSVVKATFRSTDGIYGVGPVASVPLPKVILSGYKVF